MCIWSWLLLSEEWTTPKTKKTLSNETREVDETKYYETNIKRQVIIFRISNETYYFNTRKIFLVDNI